LLSTIATFLLPFTLIFLQMTAYEKNSAHTIKAAIRFFLVSYSFFPCSQTSDQFYSYSNRAN
jgi:hypothetical protein